MTNLRVNVLHLLSGSDSVTALNAVQKLLRSGEHNVHERETEGITALHVAAAWDNLAMCQLLMHFGADPLAEDEHGRTPKDLATGTTKQFFSRVLDSGREGETKVLRRSFLNALFCCFSPQKPSNCISRRRKCRSFCHVINSASKEPVQRTNEGAFNAPGSETPRRPIYPKSLPHELSKQLSDHYFVPSQFDGGLFGTDAIYTKHSTPNSTIFLTADSATAVVGTSAHSVRSHSTSPVKDTSECGKGSKEYHKVEIVNDLINVPDSELLTDWITDDSSFISGREDDHEKSKEFQSCIDKVRNMNNEEIKRQINSRGESIGPVSPENRCAYEIKLARMLANLSPIADGRTMYSPALESILRGESFSLGQKLEEVLSADFFGKGDKNWREGNHSTSFCYILIDPSMIISPQACKLKEFLGAVFYIGKGKRSRPLNHLIEAKKAKDSKTEKNRKVLRILDLWSKGYGIVSLHVFQNIMPVEAYTREAAMIDAYGLNNLTNVKRGDYYGISKEWTLKEKTMYGSYLLVRALEVFHVEGCRQLFASDIHDP
ncbi:hypothetical protein AB6A40_004285 [Gnathostoma spinigerum]|uniref:Ankyrin repeat and LEM domain-containing protein 1 n=1 Tax=Gnathostoma spinigerum TaxID=75299 RepID=A0ABD6EJI5_9BILA